MNSFQLVRKFIKILNSTEKTGLNKLVALDFTFSSLLAGTVNFEAYLHHIRSYSEIFMIKQLHISTLDDKTFNLEFILKIDDRAENYKNEIRCSGSIIVANGLVQSMEVFYEICALDVKYLREIRSARSGRYNALK